ncbi:MAG: ABC transporter substrate-binding protein [Spirochaetaceae bacterium]|nr:ABC transporter substrate-binding protein [Spirochaetaceae bacterium]
MKKGIIAVALGIAVAVSGFANAAQQQQKSGGTYIAIVCKGFMHQFWVAVKNGADKAASELKAQGVNLTHTFEGTENETMVDKQMEMFQAALGKSPAALGFAALDSKAAIPLLNEAKNRKIPIIAFDSGVDSDIPLTTVSTDNKVAAGVAADKMAEAIGGSGKIALVVHDQTSRTGIDRRDGFLNGIKKYPGIEVVSVQYGGGDHQKSADITKALINANPDIKGIFGSNEGSAVGVVLGVQELGKSGQVIVIGYDSGKQQIDAIRSGLMYGAIQQNPVKMGYETLMWAYKASKGETPPKFIDSGYVWADKSNIDSPEVKSVIYE